MEHYVPLQAAGDSQCYRCRYWDWMVPLEPDEWQHICTNPAQFTPGDWVRECPGFSKLE